MYTLAKFIPVAVMPKIVNLYFDQFTVKLPAMPINMNLNLKFYGRNFHVRSDPICDCLAIIMVFPFPHTSNII